MKISYAPVCLERTDAGWLRHSEHVRCWRAVETLSLLSKWTHLGMAQHGPYRTFEMGAVGISGSEPSSGQLSKSSSDCVQDWCQLSNRTFILCSQHYFLNKVLGIKSTLEPINWFFMRTKNPQVVKMTSGVEKQIYNKYGHREVGGGKASILHTFLTSHWMKTAHESLYPVNMNTHQQWWE